MIIYHSGMFGLRNLFRIHGSPVYKVFIPTACSTAFLIVMAHARYNNKDEKSVQHPYSIAAFIGFFSFLLTFRLNFAYSRYWEGATAVHQMLSKWLDVAMTLAAWHYQAESYNDIKPPAFGLNPLATPDNMPDRPHAIQPSLQDTVETIHKAANASAWYKRYKPRLRKLNELEQIQKANERQVKKGGEYSVRSQAPVKFINKKTTTVAETDSDSFIPVPTRFREKMAQDQAQQQPPHGRPSLVKQPRGSLKLTRTRRARMPSPSLFLQELAHLSSLLSAVALSTLRNDIEMAESPLTEYIPGQPWPPVSSTVT